MYQIVIQDESNDYINNIFNDFQDAVEDWRNRLLKNVTSSIKSFVSFELDRIIPETHFSRTIYNRPSIRSYKKMEDLGDYWDTVYFYEKKPLLINEHLTNVTEKDFRNQHPNDTAPFTNAFKAKMNDLNTYIEEWFPKVRLHLKTLNYGNEKSIKRFEANKQAYIQMKKDKVSVPISPFNNWSLEDLENLTFEKYTSLYNEYNVNCV